MESPAQGRRGRLYLIPTPLGDYPPELVLPAPVLELLPSLKTFVVEEVRSARRFLSAAGLRGRIQELAFHELNEHTPAEAVPAMVRLFDEGDVGLLSEAGLPAVADPGALLVAQCHRAGVEVVPLTGPSSLMLALMASGLDGQHFAFRGYLSAKSDRRVQEVRSLERDSAHATQILIETPYRNDSLLADLLGSLRPTTMLCIAADITLPTQFIRTLPVRQWRQAPPTIGKRPCVFLIHS